MVTNDQTLTTGTWQSVVFIFCKLSFFHDCCKSVESQNNYFRWAVKPVFLAQYCTTNSQGSTHFCVGFYVSYSFNMFFKWLDGYMCPMPLNAFIMGGIFSEWIEHIILVSFSSLSSVSLFICGWYSHYHLIMFKISASVPLLFY